MTSGVDIVAVGCRGWLRNCQRAMQPAAPLAQVVSHKPELPQGGPQPQGQLHLAPLQRPMQRRPQVVVIPPQPIQPRALIWPNKVRFRLLGLGQVIAGVRPLHGSRFPATPELLQPILANRRQHHQARLTVCLFLRRALKQALVYERGDAVEDSIQWTVISDQFRLITDHCSLITASAASRLKPPTKTESCRKSCCSPVSSKS
ncbi:MAG: hypothetical protein ACE5LU_27825 [Anaerolineae bacterium]